MLKIVVYSILLSVVLSGCGSLPLGLQKGGDWPSSIPPKEVYVAAYQADKANAAHQGEDNYLLWVKRFYVGWVLYPRGWHWLMKEVDKNATDDNREQLAAMMASLGERISVEWPKSYATRTVNTSHLMTWGDVLKLSVKKDAQIDVVNQISQDVDDLLARNIYPDDIHFDRYFTDAQQDQHDAVSSAMNDEDSEHILDPFDM